MCSSHFHDVLAGTEMEKTVMSRRREWEIRRKVIISELFSSEKRYVNANRSTNIVKVTLGAPIC